MHINDSCFCSKIEWTNICASQSASMNSSPELIFAQFLIVFFFTIILLRSCPSCLKTIFYWKLFIQSRRMYTINIFSMPFPWVLSKNTKYFFTFSHSFTYFIPTQVCVVDFHTKYYFMLNIIQLRYSSFDVALSYSTFRYSYVQYWNNIQNVSISKRISLKPMVEFV